MLSRRGLLVGLVAAPAVLKLGLYMPIKKLIVPPPATIFITVGPLVGVGDIVIITGGSIIPFMSCRITDVNRTGGDMMLANGDYLKLEVIDAA